MRTLGHCQKHGLELYIGCGCGAARWRQAREECKAMAAFTIEELQRMGWFACEGCGSRQPGVMIYYRGPGYPLQLEGWRGSGGSRPMPVNGSGY